MSRIIKSRLGFGMSAGEATAGRPTIVKYNFNGNRHDIRRTIGVGPTYGIGILPPPRLVVYPLGNILPISFLYGACLAVTNVSQYDNLNIASDVERYRTDTNGSYRSSMTRLNARYHWDSDHDAR